MYSKTYGRVNIPNMLDIIKKYIEEDESCEYNITVGTDSHNRKLTKVVIVVAIHRVGKGAYFFMM